MSDRRDVGCVLVIPCSGIGKVQGLISREAAYMVIDELAKGETESLCLALLVKGDAQAVEKVRAQPCITIDGCGKACARTSVEVAGGQPIEAVQAAEFFKTHRGAQPGTAGALKPDGWDIVTDIAETVASVIARVVHGLEVAP